MIHASISEVGGGGDGVKGGGSGDGGKGGGGGGGRDESEGRVIPPEKQKMCTSPLPHQNPGTSPS